MATSLGTIEFILDQLSDLAGVRARKMFGEYALYYHEKVVALVCDNQLFVKITQPGKDLLGERFREGEAYPGAKPSILVAAEDLEDGDSLSQLIRVTASALPRSKPRKQTKAGPGTKRRQALREETRGGSDGSLPRPPPKHREHSTKGKLRGT